MAFGFKRKIGAALYYMVAQHLPPSYSGVKIGQKALRGFCGKLMLASCGKEVNIEKNAYFSPKVSLGDYSGIGVNARIHGACIIGSHVMMGEDCIISRGAVVGGSFGPGEEKSISVIGKGKVIPANEAVKPGEIR